MTTATAAAARTKPTDEKARSLNEGRTKVRPSSSPAGRRLPELDAID
jgi:hypothetical protein